MLKLVAKHSLPVESRLGLTVAAAVLHSLRVGQACGRAQPGHPGRSPGPQFI